MTTPSQAIREKWRRADRQEDREALVREELHRSPDDPALLHLAAVTYWGDAEGRPHEYLRQALARTDDPNLLTQCGHLLLDLGDLTAAIEAAKRARPALEEGFPLEAELLHLTGRLAAQRGDVESAKTLLEGLFAEEPQMSGLGYHLAHVHIQLQDAQRAREVVTEALKHSQVRRLEDLRAALEDANAMPPPEYRRVMGDLGEYRLKEEQSAGTGGKRQTIELVEDLLKHLDLPE